VYFNHDNNLGIGTILWVKVLVLCYRSDSSIVCSLILCDYILDFEAMENEAKICLMLNHQNIGTCEILVRWFLLIEYVFENIDHNKRKICTIVYSYIDLQNNSLHLSP